MQPHFTFSPSINSHMLPTCYRRLSLERGVPILQTLMLDRAMPCSAFVYARHALCACISGIHMR